MPSISTDRTFDPDKLFAVNDRILECAPHALEIRDRIEQAANKRDVEVVANYEESTRFMMKAQELESMATRAERDEHHGVKYTNQDRAKLIERPLEEAKKFRAKQKASSAKVNGRKPVLKGEAVDSALAAIPAGATIRPRVVNVGNVRDFPKALATNLAKQGELDKQRRRVDLGPLPTFETIPAMKQKISRLAKSGKPNVSNARYATAILEGQRAKAFGDVRWPIRVGRGLVEHVDTFPLLVYLLEDQIVAKLTAQIEQESTGTEIPTAERAAMLADIDAELTELRYQEAALIIAAEDAGGFDVYRRADMDPLAALQIEVVT